MRHLLIGPGLPRTDRITAVACIVTLLLITIGPRGSDQPFLTLQPGFSEALTAINQAQAAGATESEIMPLVSLLNNALTLNKLALEGPYQSENRSQLLSQVDQILISVTDNANSLTIIASQKTNLQRLVSYLFGIIAAVLGTVVYVFVDVAYKKYRIKRTFQTRIRLK